MDSGDRPRADDADEHDDVAVDEPDRDGADEPDRDGADEPDRDRADEPDRDDADEPDRDRADEPDRDTDRSAMEVGENTDLDDEDGELSTSTPTSSASDTESAAAAGGDTAAAESTTGSAGKPSGSAAEQVGPSRSSSTATDAEPAPEPGTAAADDAGGDPVHRFFNAQRGPLMWIREMLSSAVVVLAIGLVLFAISGVWPPMVAVESGSMDPNMEKGDLIFVTEPGRFAPDAATSDAGVVTYQQGAEADYTKFGNPGSVIVYHQPGRVGSPIIHRARFHVEAGENWYDRADPAHMRADNCEELTNCPAPHAGFITKGDANSQYDQANGISPPVKAEWITGVARLRIPYLGWVRLIATGQATPLGISPGTTLFAAGASAVAVGRRSRGAA